MSDEKVRLSLGKKILLLTLAMCVVICAVSLAGTYMALRAGVRKNAEDMGVQLAEQVITKVPATRFAQLISGSGGAEDLRSVREQLELRGDVLLSVLVPRGDQWLLACQMSSEAPSAVPGSEAIVDARLLYELKNLGNSHGSLEESGVVTVFYPVRQGDGSLAGCVLCELDMGEAYSAANDRLGKLAVLVALVVLAVMLGYMAMIRSVVVQPIQKLTDAVQAYEGGENKESLRKLELKGSDELHSLADAFRMMLVEIDLRGFEERELAVREERVEAELKLTTAINAAMTPKALPEREGEPIFDVRGLSDQSGELNCDFYDYFLMPDGRLCLVVGSVPSQGVSAALFMVVAKTTLKNQLRTGMPLLDAVTEANRQLYEVGQGMVVNALVGILGEKGEFSYVNAGQEQPLLMRAQDRFEWQQGPVYAPLGQNENVFYRERTIRLAQGDRMFFHTAGLSQISGEGGERFGSQRLQAMLNLSRSKNLSPQQLLDHMRGEGKAFARDPRRCGGFSMVAMDYLRRRKELAHCVVDRDRSGAMRVSEFLKEQLAENGFDRRNVAQIVVLADEVFSLCCRRRTEGLVTVECEVNSDACEVRLRLKSFFAGADPLDVRGGTDTQDALDFIRRSTREISFRKGELQDELTVVIPVELCKE